MQRKENHRLALAESHGDDGRPRFLAVVKGLEVSDAACQQAYGDLPHLTETTFKYC